MNNSATLDKTTCTIISLIFLVLVLRNSLYTDLSPILHMTLSGVRFICWGLFIMLFLHSPKKIDGLGFWFILYGGVIGYSTLAHHSGAPFTVISVGFDILMIWGICKIYLPTYGEYIVRSIIIAMSVCIYLNFLLLFIYPNGLWTTIGGKSFYLLGGNYNQMGRTIIPAIAISGFYRIRYNQMKLNHIALVLCSMLTLLYVGSKTSLVGIALLLAFYFIRSYRLRKWIIVAFFIGYTLFQTLAVFQQADFSQNEFIVYFVEDVLHKDLTFTHRTRVWLGSMMLIKESPIIGYGYQVDSWYTDQLHVTTTHNMILGQLVSGGFIGLTLFISIIISALRQYIKYSFPAMQFLFFGLCTFFFMMIMEVYPIMYIALILILLHNSKNFAPDTEIETTEEITEQQ